MDNKITFQEFVNNGANNVAIKTIMPKLENNSFIIEKDGITYIYYAIPNGNNKLSTCDYDYYVRVFNKTNCTIKQILCDVNLYKAIINYYTHNNKDILNVLRYAIENNYNIDTIPFTLMDIIDSNYYG